MDTNVHKLPIFVFPNILKFYLNSRQTHKQLLTLYNPYDFSVRFKVLSTAPTKYTVIDPEGNISPHSCVDIVIRHTMPLATNCNVTDQFRITMKDHANKQIVGKRDLEAKLLPGEIEDISNDGGDHFHSLPKSEITEQRNVQYPIRSFQRATPMPTSTNFIAVITGIVCIFALLLPTKDEKQEPPSSIPIYLHPSMNLKLVFAYVLGLVSMVIFRP